MRVRPTIDADVAAELERLRRSRDASLNEAVNDALRRGLRDMNAKPKTYGPFRTQTSNIKPLVNIDNVAEAIAYAEGEDYK